MRILSINAAHAGGTHDSFIWRHSRVREQMERNYHYGEHFWLIGDSGYPLQPWLLTPILNSAPGSPQERYTASLTSARSSIERCNGTLKLRFRCLLGERTLRYSPEFVGTITTACAVLHNICIAGRLNFEELVEYEHDNILGNEVLVHAQLNDVLNEGQRIRDNLIRNYFR